MEFALQQPASDLQLLKASYVGQRSGIGDSTFTVLLADSDAERERSAAPFVAAISTIDLS
jgi:hypothetical protein